MIAELFDWADEMDTSDALVVRFLDGAQRYGSS